MAIDTESSSLGDDESMVVAAMVRSTKSHVSVNRIAHVIRAARIGISDQFGGGVVSESNVKHPVARVVSVGALHREGEVRTIVDARVADVYTLPLADRGSVAHFRKAHLDSSFSRLRTAAKSRADLGSRLLGHRLTRIDSLWHRADST